MEKIKKILSPGHSKDDEVMYRDDNQSNATRTADTTAETSRPSRVTADEHTGLNSRTIEPADMHSHTHAPTHHGEQTKSAIPSHMSTAGADDAASISSIRSGVVGAAQPPVAAQGASGASPVTGDHSGLHSHSSGRAQGLEHKSHDHTFNPVPGPHPTAIANMLDPNLHVPGEFPASSSDDLPATSYGNNSNDQSTYRDDTSSSVPARVSSLGTSQQQDSSRRDAPLTGISGFEEQRFDPSARSTDHHGHNAALGTAAGVAGVGAYESTRHGRDTHAPTAGVGASESSRHAGSTEQDPASFTTGPHSSNLANIVDPRVRPDPAKMKGHTTSDPHQSQGATRAAPEAEYNNRTEQGNHHHQNAALAGGLGAAGAGAYETSRHSGSTQQDPASFTTGPHSSNLANIVDPRVRPEPEKMKGHTASDSYQSNLPLRTAPGADYSNRTEQDNHHQNAPLAAGLGAGGVGAYEAGRHSSSAEHHSAPVSSTAGPHQSNTLNRADPRVDSDSSRADQGHHYGRDAAIAGGVGAAGAAGYAATRDNGPGTSQTYQQPHGASTTAGPHQSDSLNRVDPRVDSDSSRTNQGHHYGRDAAAVGGVGAAGAAAYGATRGDGPAVSQTYQQPHSTSTTAGPHQSNTANRADPRVDSDLSKADKGHHYGRDAAILGGVGAAGAAGYGAARNDGLAAPQGYQQPLATPTGAPQDARIFDQTQQVPDSKQVDGGWAADTKAQEKLQKQQEKEAKAHEKEVKAQEKEAKAHEKEVAHEQKKAHEAEKAHEKEIALEQKKAHEAEKAHEKEVAAQKKQAHDAEKAHEKEVALEKKQAHDAEKAREKEQKLAQEAEKAKEKEGKEKKHGLFGFLHRDKEPKENVEETKTNEPLNLRERDIQAHQAHQRELEEAAAAGKISVAGASFEPSLRDQEEHDASSSHHRVSTDNEGRNRLHKEPPARVQRELEQKAREHENTSGTTANAPHTTAGDDGIVTDSHTGLPKNVGKYGTGFGGTDASNTVRHDHVSR